MVSEMTAKGWIHLRANALWYFFLRFTSRAAFCFRRSSKMSRSRYVCVSGVGWKASTGARSERWSAGPPLPLPALVLREEVRGGAVGAIRPRSWLPVVVVSFVGLPCAALQQRLQGHVREQLT